MIVSRLRPPSGPTPRSMTRSRSLLSSRRASCVFRTKRGRSLRLPSAKDGSRGRVTGSCTGRRPSDELFGLVFKLLRRAVAANPLQSASSAWRFWRLYEVLASPERTLLIRGSLVRAQVGEPPFQGLRSRPPVQNVRFV